VKWFFLILEENSNQGGLTVKYKYEKQRHHTQVFTITEKRDSQGRLIKREIINWRREPRKKVYNKHTKKYEFVD